MKTVIEMAREAGFDGMGQRVLSPVIEGSDLSWLLERFAELVRADERARLHPKRVKEDDYCQGDERYYANE